MNKSIATIRYFLLFKCFVYCAHVPFPLAALHPSTYIALIAYHTQYVISVAFFAGQPVYHFNAFRSTAANREVKGSGRTGGQKGT